MFRTSRRVLLLLAALSAPAAAESFLIFELAPNQEFGATVGDPTVRPMFSNGSPAGMSFAAQADLIGSGRDDLIPCYASSPPFDPLPQPCRVLRPQADGTLVEATRATFGDGPLPSRIAPSSVAAGKFNGDARPDLFVSATGYDFTPFSGEKNMLLLSGPGVTLVDASANLPQIDDYSFTACTADVNGDGKDDVYNNSFRASYLLLGDGAGGFTQNSALLPDDVASAAKTFTACLFADLDNDLKPDLVLGQIAPNGSQRSIVLLNNGGGDFKTRARITLPTGAYGDTGTITAGIRAVRIDEDEWKDLLLMSYSTNYVGTAVQALMNQGDGSFLDETAARIQQARRDGGLPCSAMDLADLNNDGHDDFFCSNGPNRTDIQYWVSSGDGTYAAVPHGVLTEGGGNAIKAVDFDLDGHLDLVYVGQSASADVNYQTFFNRGVQYGILRDGFE